MKLFIMSTAKRATRCRCVENAKGCRRIACDHKKRLWGANPSKFAGVPICAPAHIEHLTAKLALFQKAGRSPLYISRKIGSYVQGNTEIVKINLDITKLSLSCDEMERNFC